jgi:hypothetical protein
VSEGILGVVFSDCKNGVFKGSDEVRNGISTQLFDKGFKFGKKTLDGVVVGGVDRELVQFAACGLDHLSYLGVMRAGPHLLGLLQ